MCARHHPAWSLAAVPWGVEDATSGLPEGWAASHHTTASPPPFPGTSSHGE